MTDAAKTKFAGLLILIVLAIWLTDSLSAFPGYVGSDTREQYTFLLEGRYVNWKPALYEWQLFLGECLWKGHGTDLAFVTQVVVYGCSFAWIVWHYTKRHYLYSLIILALPVLFTKGVMGQTSVVNDYMAIAACLLYIASVLAASEHEKGCVRKLLAAVAVVALFYTMVLRHNSIFMILVLAYWGIGKLLVLGRVKRLLSSLGLAAAFLVSSHCINTYALQCEESYPLKSAFADDIINISILGNEWEPVCKLHYNVEGISPASRLFVPEAGHWAGIIRGTTIEEDRNEREQIYLTVRDGWLESVSRHPLRYVGIKLFFFHQFLLEGRALPWACDLLHSRYPHVRIFMEGMSRTPVAWLNRQFFSFSVIPLTAYLIFALFALRVILKRKWSVISSLPEESKDAILLTGASLMYTLSFVPFVLSVSEIRYFCIRATLTYIALALLILTTVIQWARGFRSSRGNGTGDARRPE